MTQTSTRMLHQHDSNTVDSTSQGNESNDNQSSGPTNHSQTSKSTLWNVVARPGLSLDWIFWDRLA